ncbi:hypothetical protein Tco_1573983, partial [Tanacetum coccineum]
MSVWICVKTILRVGFFFPDLAGAVIKISESVKKIEQNFDNALGSTSNANDSNAWSSEFVPFMEPKDGSGIVGSYSAKKKDSSAPSEKNESLSHPQEFSITRLHSVRYGGLNSGQ